MIAVTYGNEADIDGFIASLRAEAASHRLRVIVADNDSPDGTLERTRVYDDVIGLRTGGNLGYAGGINAAMAAAGDADAILILNPDLVLTPGVVAALRHRLSQPGVGAVVPTIVDGVGTRTISLRREPSILRSLGDALFGARLRRRPAAFSELVLAPDDYRSAHPVDWATGAALLVSRTAARAIGDWDERFFLYSEETDFFRRARDAGYTIWFEPAGIVRHSEGGSGASLALEQLLAVNRIRYFAKHHGRVATFAFHGTAVLNEITRCAHPRHRVILRTLLWPRSWPSLPRARRSMAEHARAAVHPDESAAS